MESIMVCGIEIIGANFCPDCGKLISPNLLHFCGVADFYIGARPIERTKGDKPKEPDVPRDKQ